MSFSQADIDAELRHGSGYAGGKLRIYAFYQHGADNKEAVKFLKDEYGWYGHSHTFLDGSPGSADYSPKGLKLRHYDPEYETTLKWNAVDKRLRQLVAEDSYLTDAEKAQYALLERDYAGLGGVPVPRAKYGFPKPEEMKAPEIPAIAMEYNAIKEAHADDLVLFQVGDFYELYGEDARQRRSRTMKLILKILAAPVALLLSLFIRLCALLISGSAFIFKLASGLLGVLALAVLLTYSVGNGLILLAAAFLICPIGLPMLAVKLLGGLQSVHASLNGFLHS